MNRLDVVQWVQLFVGCSLDERTDELARLVDFPGGPPASEEVKIKTNCAMFVLGIWRQCGCVHPFLTHPYHNGMAMAWVLEIARQCKALHLPHDGTTPQMGDVCHYATPPKPGLAPRNDDHVEFLLTNPSEHRLALHAGGGRARNAITESVVAEDYTMNHWRPLRHWIDTTLVIGTAGAA
jgi:hypothetical protein